MSMQITCCLHSFPCLVCRCDATWRTELTWNSAAEVGTRFLFLFWGLRHNVHVHMPSSNVKTFVLSIVLTTAAIVTSCLSLSTLISLLNGFASPAWVLNISRWWNCDHCCSQHWTTRKVVWHANLKLETRIYIRGKQILVQKWWSNY